MDTTCGTPPSTISTPSRGRSDWRVAALRCYELGLSLKGVPRPNVARRLSADPKRAVLGEVLVAAVCHSTNWDRLRGAMGQVAADPERFMAQRLATMDLSTFRVEFGHGFAPDESLVSRHRTFTETAALVASRRYIDVDALLGGSTRLGGEAGLYEQLRRIPAFARDPEAKKARILVQELCRTRLIHPVDPDVVRPAIEYHLIRLYLRTQRVTPVRPDDDRRLQRNATFRAPVIMRIRRAVEEAMYFTATAAEMPIFDLNQIEWQIARSFCERDSPRCDGPPRPDKPCDNTVLALANDLACPFSGLCGGPGDPRLVRVVEPHLSAKYDFY